MNNHKIPSSFPAALPSAGRREDERSETDRRAADGKAEAILHPDPEVAAQAVRRRFTAEYKQRILAEADRAKSSGGSARCFVAKDCTHLCSLLGGASARPAFARPLAPQRRGPKSKRDPVQEENQKLHRDNLRLTEQLRRAEIVIDVQKKVAALLGWPIATPEQEPKP
jgi:hypothetical protein